MPVQTMVGGPQTVSAGFMFNPELHIQHQVWSFQFIKWLNVGGCMHLGISMQTSTSQLPTFVTLPPHDAKNICTHWEMRRGNPFSWDWVSLLTIHIKEDYIWGWEQASVGTTFYHKVLCNIFMSQIRQLINIEAPAKQLWGALFKEAWFCSCGIAMTYLITCA